MTRHATIPTCTIAALLTLGAIAPTAGADGLPVPGITVDRAGVSAPGLDVRYRTDRAERGTVVQRLEAESNRVIDSTTVADRLTVPAVALDGTASGLSADGSTLVLIEPRRSFPQRETHLAVLDAERLSLERRITLDGDFSFDAISPDGSRLYLIEYLSQRNPTNYAVRAYDVGGGRLLPDPIVDPDEPAEEMGGYPWARAVSPDGRWAYTLYDGREHPFVHALDTREGRAACIDLHGLEGALWRASLDVGPNGDRLTVLHRGQPTLRIDTASFEVTRVPPPPPPQFPDRTVAPPADTISDARGNDLAWELGATIALILATGFGLWAIAGRRRPRTHPLPDADAGQLGDGEQGVTPDPLEPVGAGRAAASRDADGAA
jgi:DNA-binding beta-propeller fold protein YncE